MTDLVQKLLTAVKDWDYAWESTGDGPDLETVIRHALADAGGAVANANGLLPCPFCGDDGCSVAVMQEGASGDDYSFSAEAQCMCGAAGPEAYGACASDAALSAINAWSCRAHPTPDSDRVAELEAHLVAEQGLSERWRQRTLAAEKQLAESEKKREAVTSDWSRLGAKLGLLQMQLGATERQLAESREREGRMRKALTSIAHSKNLTATPQQWADHLQREALAALAAEQEKK